MDDVESFIDGFVHCLIQYFFIFVDVERFIESLRNYKVHGINLTGTPYKDEIEWNEMKHTLYYVVTFRPQGSM